MKELWRVRQSWSIERWFTELGPECRPKEWNAEESGSNIDSKVLIVFGSISLVFFPSRDGKGGMRRGLGVSDLDPRSLSLPGLLSLHVISSTLPQTNNLLNWIVYGLFRAIFPK